MVMMFVAECCGFGAFYMWVLVISDDANRWCQKILAEVALRDLELQK
jgi:hypothetical protein